jgi:hypothetical protein
MNEYVDPESTTVSSLMAKVGARNGDRVVRMSQEHRNFEFLRYGEETTVEQAGIRDGEVWTVLPTEELRATKSSRNRKQNMSNPAPYDVTQNMI